MKNYVYICNYAADYSGNFIASLLRVSYFLNEKSIYFIFPEESKNKSWIRFFDKEKISYCKFNNQDLGIKLKELNLNSNDTIVHTHFVEEFNLLPVKKYFKKIICHYHCTIHQPKSFFRRTLKRVIMNLVYKNLIIVGVSPAIQVELKKYFILSKVRCIPNAVDFENLNRKNSEKNFELSKEEKKYFNILIFGTHFMRKGVDIAIKSLIFLNEKSLKYKLYIVVHDIKKTEQEIKNIFGGEYEKISSFIKIIKVIQNVKELYDEMDLFISPSREEAFGYAVVESSFSNCQVLASDVPGQDFMKNVPGIIWVKKDDVQSLIKGIESSLKNKEKNICLNIKADQRSFVLKNFSINKWVERNVELYNYLESNKN